MFLDLLFPPVCWICDRHLEIAEKVVCQTCFAQLENYSLSTDEFSGPGFVFDRLYVLFEFDERLRTLVHMLKYQGCRSLAENFAFHAFTHLKHKNSKHYTRIIAVPLHPLRRRERGYNQSGEIARCLSTYVPVRHADNPLTRTRPTRTQTKLSKLQRIKNISGAFKCNENLSGEDILVVDDVITTGSTVNECSQVLLDAGAASVDVLALANPRLADKA